MYKIGKDDVKIMTAQIPDYYIYKNDEYKIVALSKSMNFNPQNYGIIPEEWISTACYRGYWCTYCIEDKILYLKNLSVICKDDIYPSFRGVHASKLEEVGFSDYYVYKNVNMPMQYTGRIVLGKDFLREYYIHMGYQRAWSYETLLEMVFENGVLLDVIDHSNEMKEIRKKIDGDFLQKLRLGDRFVEESFSLDLKEKCWWFK